MMRLLFSLTIVASDSIVSTPDGTEPTSTAPTEGTSGRAIFAASAVGISYPYTLAIPAPDALLPTQSGATLQPAPSRAGSANVVVPISFSSTVL